MFTILQFQHLASTLLHKSRPLNDDAFLAIAKLNDKDPAVNVKTLDLSKLFELQVLVIEYEQDLLHLMKQMLQSLGIRSISSCRHINELPEKKEKWAIDVILLAASNDDQHVSSDWIESLIAKGFVSSRTRLIMLLPPNANLSFIVEYPYLPISHLTRPFNKQQLDAQLKHHVLCQPVLKPIFALANLRRFSDALKIVLHNQQKKLAPAILTQLQKLKIQLLLDSDKYDVVLPLLKNPLATQQDWALWALFRIRYERGDHLGCEAFLVEHMTDLQHQAERRDAWRIYLALQRADYQQACQIANAIPNLNMSLHMVRLVHAVLLLSGQFSAALDFIERKRRLAVLSEQQLALAIAHARALMFISLKQATQLSHAEEGSDPAGPEYSAQLEQVLAYIQQHLEFHTVQTEFKLLHAHHQLQQGQTATAKDLLSASNNHENRTNLHTNHGQGEPNNSEPVAIACLCHQAVVYRALGQIDDAIACLFQAQQHLATMFDNSRRLFANCLLESTLQMVIPTAERAKRYAELAERHRQHHAYYTAAKMYHAAWLMSEHSPTEAQHNLHQLLELMRQLGLPQFRGLRLPS